LSDDDVSDIFPSIDPALVNTGGEFQHDPGIWDSWTGLDVVAGTHNGQAIEGDAQTFRLPVLSTPFPGTVFGNRKLDWTSLASRSIACNTLFKERTATEARWTLNWYYTWTNEPWRATAADYPFMGATWVGAADGSDNHDSEFIDSNVGGLSDPPSPA
jgi:hypothetical protein